MEYKLSNRMEQKLHKFAELITERIHMKYFSYQELLKLAKENGFNCGVVNYTIVRLKELRMLRIIRVDPKRYEILA